MFRTEQSHKFHVISIVEDVDGGAELAVHAARIGHKTDSAPLDFPETMLFQHFDSGHDLGISGHGGDARNDSKWNRQYLMFQCIQHII